MSRFLTPHWNGAMRVSLLNFYFLKGLLNMQFFLLQAALIFRLKSRNVDKGHSMSHGPI